MTELVRFGISMPEDLLARFDELIREKGYSNRSEALRDLVRDALVRRQWEEEDAEVVGTITLIYDHNKHELTDRLIDLQHDHHQHILATMHIHLDEDHCLEVLAVRGPARTVQRIADLLLSQKGVKHGKLTITSTGAAI